MSDIIDKAILVGMGLEKKARELVEELQKMGKEGVGEAGQLPPKHLIENKIVEDGIKVLREFVNALSMSKDKLDKELTNTSERLLEKLHIATQNDMEVIKEMARIAREKVDSLEKRVQELEARLNK